MSSAKNSKAVRFPSFEPSQPVRAFIARFLADNRQIDRKFSTRFFATKLGWPRSLLTDVAAGRKHLSVRRALEFCKFARLSERQTQLFVMKAVCEADSPPVKRFLDRFIALNHAPVPGSDDPSEREVTIFSDAYTCLVLALVKSRPGIRITEVRKTLRRFEGERAGCASEALERLRLSGMLELRDRACYPVDRLPFMLLGGPGEKVRWTPRSFLESLTRHVDDPRGFSAICGATVPFPKDRFKELKERLEHLRDWIIASSEECIEERRSLGVCRDLSPIQVLIGAFSGELSDEPTL